MNAFIVGFSKPKSKLAFFSHLIRLCEKTKFSHAYVKVYSTKYDRWLVYQASGSMVNFMNVEEFEKKNISIEEYPINIDEKTRTEIMQFAIDNVGKPYALAEVFGILFYRLTGLRNPFAKGRNAYKCTELLAAILINVFGLNIKENLDNIGLNKVREYVIDLYEINK